MNINNLEFTSSLEDILQELRSQLSMNGINLLRKTPRESGNNIQVQCIYHGDGQERKPSAGLRKDTGVFHCFSCGAVHDFPEFISNCFGHNDKGAFGWQWLLKNFLTIEKEERNVNLDFSRRNSSNDRSSGVDNNNRYITEMELQRYRRPHGFWRRRGIKDEAIIKLFDLGYDENTHSVTFPVRDVNGNCLFVARRSVQTKFFSYPEGVKKPLYGLYELSRYWKGEYNIEVSDEYGALHDIREYARPYVNEIIVCESMIDCILLWQAGHYSVALNGLGNDLQMKQLSELPCRKLILATDNDEQGLKARDRLKKYVKGKFFTEINYPKDVKDPGDLTEEERLHILDYEEF